MIPLIGPGGAGKSTIGALLAERLDVLFVDLDRHIAARAGDITEYIGRHGYDAYARENVEAYCLLFCGDTSPDVVALSSGFMTYSSDAHPEYARVRREIEECTQTFLLLPSLDRELCVAETVRRQVARPFGRSPEREEAVIRRGSRSPLPRFSRVAVSTTTIDCTLRDRPIESREVVGVSKETVQADPSRDDENW